MAELNRVREALRASMTAFSTLEVRGDQARVMVAPDPEQLAMHLEQVDTKWEIRWACEHFEPPVVRVTLTVAGITREGLATAYTLWDAKLAALADAARFFGLTLPKETQWVEYDPDEGANTTDLEEESPIPLSASPVMLPPEPVRDLQMEKARRHIEDLLEQLKVIGKGGEAARILMRGYGETLEESRAIYKELHLILKS